MNMIASLVTLLGMLADLLVPIVLIVLIVRFFRRLTSADYHRARVAEMNAEHGLSFDAEHILGAPLTEFMVLDPQHRKLAICILGDKTSCRIEDFSWLRGWRLTQKVWGNTSVCRVDLETSDRNRPQISFIVPIEEGPPWIARLDRLINGQPRERLR